MMRCRAFRPPSGYEKSERSVSEGPDKLWINRVKSVKDNFEPILFYNIKAVTRKGTAIKPRYSTLSRSSYYVLSDESEYHVEIDFYDLQAGQSGLDVKEESDELTLYTELPNRLGTESDTRFLILHTHSLSRQRAIASTRLAGTYRQPATSGPVIDYEVDLQWHITKGKWKPWAFGAFSALAAAAAAGVGVGTENLGELSLNTTNALIGILSLLFIGVAAGFLFQLFDKK